MRSLMRWTAACVPLFLVVSGEIAIASCGASGCSVHDVTGIGAGALGIRYEFEFVDQDEPWIGLKAAGVGDIRGHHDEVMTRTVLHRGVVSLGLSDRLAVEARIPVLHREHEHIHHHKGVDHLEHWHFTALADPSARVTGVLAGSEDRRTAWTGSLGLKMPWGKRSAVNEHGDPAETGILPGTGSWDVTGGTAVKRRFAVRGIFGGEGEAESFLGVSGRFNTPGIGGYRLGHELRVDAGGTWPVTGSLGVVFQLNGLVRGRDDPGETREEVAKTGGSFVYATPGLEIGIGRTLRLTAVIQLPVYRRVNAIQITAPWQAWAAVEYRVGVF